MLELGFTGVSHRQKWEKVPIDSFGLQRGSQPALRCVLIRSWTLRHQLIKHAVKPFPGKKWEMGVLPAHAALGLDGISHGECSCAY